MPATSSAFAAEVVSETELEAPGASVALAAPDVENVAVATWAPTKESEAVFGLALTLRTVKTPVTVVGASTSPRSIARLSMPPVAFGPGVTEKWLES